MPYIVLIGLTLFFCSPMAYAQTKRIAWNELGVLYAHARFQLSYQAYIGQHGEFIRPLEPSLLPVLSDTLITLGRKGLGLDDSELNPEDFNGMIHSWSLTSADDRSEWISQFQNIQWAYLGSNFFTPIDTMSTPVLRGHLEAYFGAPTHTAIEKIQGDPTPGDGNGQFEYWLVVNESIPVIVMDVFGPFDRGVILATDHQFRASMFAMRQSLLRNAILHTMPAAYVDYYYNQVSEQWYRTGYDGTSYFTDPVSQPDFRLGRPVLSNLEE